MLFSTFTPQSSPFPLSPPLLEVQQLHKRIGGLTVLENIQFQLQPGEVVGVVGRRGAGKSTLLNCVAGYTAVTQGTIRLNGQPIRTGHPHDLLRRGVNHVPPQAILVEQLTVLQNIFLGRETGWQAWLGWPDRANQTRRAQELLALLDMPPTLLHVRVGQLSDEERQIVAIARALAQPSRLLLLDDALSALTFQRQEKMLAHIPQLADQGTAVLIASDNLKHLFAVTHRLMVLYGGKLLAERQTNDTTPRDIIELMVGSTRSEQVTPIIWALESYHIAQRQVENLRLEQANLQQSLDEQDSLNRQLVRHLQAQLEKLDELNLALQFAQRRLMTEREEERKYLARELHDTVIQDLLSFNYQLEELESEAAAQDQAELTAVRHGIRDVIGSLRQLCSDLRPPSLDRHGLVTAIRSYAQDWAERTAVELTLNLDNHLGRLPEAVELSLFRIIQEGLNNIHKHAQANTVELTLQHTPQANLLIRLSDNGRGMAAQPDLSQLSAQKHFGLLSISERVALLGGSMQTLIPPQGGLTLHIEIPSPAPSI